MLNITSLNKQELEPISYATAKKRKPKPGNTYFITPVKWDKATPQKPITVKLETLSDTSVVTRPQLPNGYSLTPHESTDSLLLQIYDGSKDYEPEYIEKVWSDLQTLISMNAIDTITLDAVSLYRNGEYISFIADDENHNIKKYNAWLRGLSDAWVNALISVGFVEIYNTEGIAGEALKLLDKLFDQPLASDDWGETDTVENLKVNFIFSNPPRRLPTEADKSMIKKAFINLVKSKIIPLRELLETLE
ncbi:hypothetical protein kac65v162_gp113 [Nodularia phage vB_NspS-kac65v162]|jgi:hypothetical protein|uniref:Uncharacterized protein n=1 Tax=Nodularia phage vB_NspS-kac65v162 TaxID=2557581 RepID=A0A482MHU4_9CAUD|nr:hypothetical protein kac65v162_gp113 [Nodularia phage vB_NspS-kac65v162]